MNPFQTLRFAFGGLAANKVRSALTMLGVLIGVAAVILLLAVGNGSSQAVKDSIEKLGTNALTVSSGSGFGGSRAGSANGTKPLTVEDARALADPSAAPHIESVAPEVTTSQTALHEGTSHTVGQVVGTYPAYFKASNSKVAKGDYFSSDDVLASRKVAVIGSTTAADLFGTADPVGRKMVLGGTPFTVVGVLSAKGGTGFQDPDDVVVAPLPTVQNAFTGFGSVGQILVRPRRRTGGPTGEGRLVAGDLELDPVGHQVLRGGRPVSLSPTEFKLLAYLMTHADRVVSKMQILEHVWAYDFGGDLSIVESYISYVRRKVDSGADGAKLIHTVRGIGYVLRRPQI
ncbi:ABC transporter permease [Streptomyces sp. NPDC051366]|uniref:ABC transporter permease n=1 Tax=Streptomyces sp. NPDC051366 TaxID=3365652 RepID=UPI0037B4237C